MESMSTVKNIDIYLDNYLKEVNEKYGIKKLRETIEKIINLKYINGFDKYSRNILALAMEKRLMLSIEKNRIYNQNTSYWSYYKTEAPLTGNNNILLDFIDLFIKDLYSKYPNNDSLKDIKKFYNNEIYNSTKMFTNKMITLPSGENVSIGDITGAVNSLIEERMPKKYVSNVKVIPYKFKKAAVISTLVSTVSVAALMNSKVSVDDNNDVTITVDIDNEYNNLNSISNNQKNNISDNIETKEKITYAEINTPEFLGYDNNCPIYLQEYMYEVAHKYDIPFNILMCIAHTESAGKFDNNGVISSTDDYGFFQINKINHSYIYENLGYTSDQLLNDQYKNIDAAAYILKGICDMYPDEVEKGNYENIFGVYNGWKNWHDKEISIDYVLKNMNLYSNIYNKSDEELFVNNRKEK